ncbi:MAG: MopE-related protein [Candidatus Aenigmatarchaeota archaeon]
MNKNILIVTLVLSLLSLSPIIGYACHVNFCSDIACENDSQCFDSCDGSLWFYGDKRCDSDCYFEGSNYCKFQYTVCADADGTDGFPETDSVVRVCGAVCDQDTDYSQKESTCYFGCDAEDTCDYVDSCSVESYCDGSVRYYDGSCSETGCSFDNEDCSEIPDEVTCSGVGTDTIEETVASYGCNLGECVIMEGADGSDWTCDIEMEYESQECGGDYYYCYYDDGYTWGDSWPESETDCFDGHDNDNDDLIDSDDDDCYECFSDGECDDSNVCTLDQCVLGYCENTCLEDGTECDDGNPNNVNDACYSGSCIGEDDDDDDGYGDDDCDDTDPAINPGAEEVCCDEIDNDCDGNVDEDCECSIDEDCNDENACTIDQCVDGFCTYINAENNTVCDDGNSSTVNDICTLGLCNGEDDDDGDTYGDDDCDDSNSEVNPGATEVCTDSIDNDCDDLVDCDDDSCSGNAACVPSTPSLGGGVFIGGGTGPNIYCGDDKCESVEDCSKCPEDCLKENQVCCGEDSFDGSCCADADCGEGYFCNPSKACEQTTGGVVTEPECVEEWVCVDWSECVDATQTRTCVDINDCGTVEEMPELEQECVEESPLTGLFTFVNSPTGYASMFILGMFLLLLFLGMRKK